MLNDGATGVGWQAVLATTVVLALLLALAWAARRNAWRFGAAKRAAIAVETAVPLGERRTLVVVAVEGRRLLLGLTPMQVTFVTELGPAPTFDAALDRASSGERS